MSLAPSPDAVGVLGAAEVVAVLGFGQPAALAGLCAGATTVGLIAEDLATAITVVRLEQLVAMQTFALRVCARHALEEDDPPRRSSRSCSPHQAAGADEEGRTVQE
jgi:hypothetical protein